VNNLLPPLLENWNIEEENNVAKRNLSTQVVKIEKFGVVNCGL
jgi:hypothetical protein